MSDPIRTIVVGVSGVAGEDRTLYAAAGLARHSGAVLHVVHGYPPPLVGVTPGMEFLDPTAGGFGDALREEMEARLHERHPMTEIVCHTAPVLPDLAILDVAALVDADLLVVGASRGRRPGEPLLGTTVQRVLRRSTVPVLVVRSLPVTALRVLATTDLSVGSAMAFDHGLQVVRTVLASPSTEIRALLVMTVGMQSPPLAEATVRRAAVDELRGFLGRHSPAGTFIGPLVRTGQPAPEIVSAARAWGADLVVMGTRAQPALSRWLMGSVAEAAIRDLPCNVLVVPPDASRRHRPEPDIEALATMA